jgi:DNA-directed RNA polymerase specialized sigma24 family protein
MSEIEFATHVNIIGQKMTSLITSYLMNEQKIKEIKLAVKKVCKAKFYLSDQEIEDFTHNFIIKVLEGKKQRPYQCVVDNIRSEYGDLRNKTIIRTNQFQEYLDYKFKAKEVKPKDIDDVIKNVDSFSRAILVLKFVWGLTHQEIADVFGTYLSYIDTKIKEVLEILIFEEKNGSENKLR